VHPSLEALLERSPEGAAHLAGCEPCRGLVALLSAASAGAPRKAVPRVERSTYSGWEDLPDARGGMGRLFRALDTRLGREVAIKQVRAAGGTESGAVTRALLARLEREAKLTARLQHPGIVVVYEVGQFEDGELFYSMPLVRGRPLSREIERRPTLSGRLGLVALITNVAEALAYSHSQDIVHRDVKPDNIIVGAFGEAVLIDWGIAKDLRAREEEEPGAEELRVLSAGLTELGVGTAQYMAPEQARGAQPSAAMDVYALGATLYHALSGEPPWGAADPSEVRRLLREGPPRPLDALAPQVPAELVHICERAMARDPLQRYASARELADELHRFQTGRLLQSRSYTAAELLRHWARRHRASLSVGAAALLALVLLTVAGFVQIDRQRRVAQDERRRAEWSLRKAQGLLASQLAVEPAQRLEALSLATAAVGPELAAATPALASSEATQGLYDAVVKGPAALSLDHPGAITNFAVSPDGARLRSAERE
jgi:tRNA A-37 threonylcarbamoyl transferase component Bud32